jgi:pSer/pThr/pTyr-binding forkhead associated (FHA) protein
VVVAGKELGTEFELTKSRVVMGRGPAVDIAVDDPTMSRQHVAFDLLGEKFRVQDLGSTNGILLNGTTVAAADLAHGDRLKIGQTVFQFLLESVEQKPRTYVVSE